MIGPFPAQCVSRLGLLLALVLLPALSALAQTVTTEIRGVDGAMQTNVRAALSLARADSLEQVSVWRLRQMAVDASDEVRGALRPFGYYRPRVDVRLEEPEAEDGQWRARVDVRPGEPVRIGEVNIHIRGDGTDEPIFRQWRDAWPLDEGRVLRHDTWGRALQELERIADRHGYFQGRFERRRVRVDAERDRANIRVDYDTGPRYRIGRIDPGDSGFGARLMDQLTILEPGQAYFSEDVDEQRDVLVRSGYFEEVAVSEEHRDDDAAVDIDYGLQRRPPNTYRATAGFGTDTGPRIQLGWLRHYLSSRGNRLNTEFGAQQQDSEFVLRSEYQHPFGDRPNDYLTAEGLLRREKDNFRFFENNGVDAVFDSYSGRREQARLTVGRLRERNLWRPHFGPLRERIFISYLNESFDAFREASFNPEQQALLAENPELEPLLKGTTDSFALGAEWTLLSMRGEGFATSGERFRARVLGASESVGSDVSFLQGYASARWHWLIADRHKLIVRGEVGYTEADTVTLDLSLGDRQLDLSLTELPELYRFKTGGDRTVRGYGFEFLSTNRNGGNHLLAGSVEYEFQVFGDWSVAAFYDAGNAFNDWNEPKLKAGAGVGVRWYTLIGPVQLDFARPLESGASDFRIHFTIGTQLL